MDPTKGVLCCGPVGPQYSKFYSENLGYIDVPSTADFIEGDTLIRYFATKQLDDWFLVALAWTSDDKFLTKTPTIFTHLLVSPAFPFIISQRRLFHTPPSHLVFP